VKINFSKSSKNYLTDIKVHISKDSSKRASFHISNLITRIKNILSYPRIGKINKIFNDENIREIFIEGYKIIYKINQNSILILMIYKNIDYDEKEIDLSK